MSRVIKILVALCICASNSCNSNFKPAQSEVIDKESFIKFIGQFPDKLGNYGVQFINKDDGWITSRTKIWKTSDGGKSWSIVYTDDSLNEDIKKIQFIDIRNGFMLKFGEIYWTKDGEQSWAYIQMPLYYPNGSVSSFEFLSDGKIGVAFGGRYIEINKNKMDYPNNAILGREDRVYVLKPAAYMSRDGGISWSEQKIDSRLGERFVDISIIDKDRIVLIGDGQHFYTTNGGKHWASSIFNPKCNNEEKSREPVEGRPATSAFTPQGIVWISYINGYIAKSSDSGKSWCDGTYAHDIWPGSTARDYENYFSDIYFVSTTKGFGLSKAGTLYKTTNGGGNWEKLATDKKYDYMYFIDKENGWLISGRDIYSLKVDKM